MNIVYDVGFSYLRFIYDVLLVQYWTESFVQWSPLGTYLATVHRQGAAVWGGATTFNRLMRCAHPQVFFHNCCSIMLYCFCSFFSFNGMCIQVKLIDFSPGERFLVTYSSHEPSNPRDTHVNISHVIFFKKCL